MSTPIQNLLVCPITKQHLLPLSEDKTALLHQALLKGELYYIDGSKLDVKPEQIRFLITENQHHLYSIVHSVPVLLEQKQIRVEL